MKNIIIEKTLADKINSIHYRISALYKMIDSELDCFRPMIFGNPALLGNK